MDYGTNRAIYTLQHENQRLQDEVEALRLQNEALSSYLQGISALQEASRHISSQDNLLKLLDEILYQALIITDTAHGSILLVDEETDELVFVMVHGEFRQDLQGYRLSMHQGIAGWVVEHGEPVVANKTRTNPNFSAEVDHTLGLVSNSILAVPLSSGKRVLGVIELVNPRDGREFTDSDATMLSLLGIIAGMALEQVEHHLERETA